MKAMLIRTGSIPVQNLNRYPSGSPSPGPIHSPRSLPRVSLRRSNSDSDVTRPGLSCRVSRTGSISFPDMSMIVEEEDEREFDFGGIGIGNGKGNGFGGGGKGGNDEKREIGEYYQQMLKLNPGDPLLLRNYAKYLHEVEKNMEKAEEYYGRAILASPGDGELLSLYGKLIWESEKDEGRAQSYFDQALHASPDDCTVLGSYAHFLWEADEDEDEDAEISQETHALVGA